MPLTTRAADDEDVAPIKALITHQAADEGDLLAIGRPARYRQLTFDRWMVENLHLP